MMMLTSKSPPCRSTVHLRAVYIVVVPVLCAMSCRWTTLNFAVSLSVRFSRCVNTRHRHGLWHRVYITLAVSFYFHRIFRRGLPLHTSISLCKRSGSCYDDSSDFPDVQNAVAVTRKAGETSQFRRQRRAHKRRFRTQQNNANVYLCHRLHTVALGIDKKNEYLCRMELLLRYAGRCCAVNDVRDSQKTFLRTGANSRDSCAMVASFMRYLLAVIPY